MLVTSAPTHVAVIVLPTLHGPSWLVLGSTIYVADAGPAANLRAVARAIASVR